MITPVSITKTRKEIFRIRLSIHNANAILTDMILIILTSMGCQGEGACVRLPEIDLSAASAQVTNTSIAVAAGGFPFFVVSLRCQINS